MKHLSVIFIVLSFALTLQALVTERFVARIENPPQAAFETFQLQDYDICAYRPGHYLDLLLDDTSFARLKPLYPSLHITQTEEQLKANLISSAKDIPGYRNYQDMVDELMQLQAQYPDLVHVSDLGDSWGAQYHDQNIPAYANFNHQVWAVKLSDNVQLTEDEPCFYFVGEHHAREPISMETVMGILNNLLEGYGTDPEITDMVNSSEIWFVPLLNPDGHKIVIDQTDVWWRKNLRDNNNNGTINIGNDGSGPDGIDLNRNYGYEWGYINASGNPNSITYHGLEPFSELETQYLKSLLESHSFLAGISYHTYGEYVLYPFGYMYDIISPDFTEQQALANSMASTITRQSGSGHYTPMHAYDLYPVSGSLDDWAYGTRGIFAYTIEMATEFIPPASYVPTIVQNNLTAAKLLLSRKNSKILKGHITNAITGEPLSAMVFVEGIDDNPLKTHQTWSNTQFGSFYRFLPVGSYQVSYSCPGYLTDTHTIHITADAPTVEDIALLPVDPVNLMVSITDLALNPIPGAVFSFVDTGLDSYTSDANGQLIIPDFYPGSYRIMISCNGYEQLTRMETINGPNQYYQLSSNAMFTDDFELDLSLWQTTGTWGRSTAQQFNGDYCLADSPTGNYTSNANGNCKLIQPINLTGVLNANLQFYAKHSIALDGDYCELAYSRTGASWQYLDHFVGTSDWQLHSYSLNHLIGGQVFLRFMFRSGYSGNSDGIYIDDVKIYTSSNPTPVSDLNTPPLELNLSSHPNPFRDKVSFVISSSAKSTQKMRLSIYNIKGQLVAEFGSDGMIKGDNALQWDGRDRAGMPCASGIYFARLNHPGATAKTLKTVLLK